MCICMIFTLLPFSALADTVAEYKGGNQPNYGQWYDHIEVKVDAQYKVSVDGINYTLTGNLKSDSIKVTIGSQVYDFSNYTVTTGSEAGRREYSIHPGGFSPSTISWVSGTYNMDNVFVSARILFNSVPDALKNIFKTVTIKNTSYWYVDLENIKYTGVQECTFGNGLRSEGNSGIPSGLDLYINAEGAAQYITKGKLAIEKKIVDESGNKINDDTEFTFIVQGNGDLSSVRYEVKVKGGKTVTLENLEPGSYTVTEIQKTGYAIRDIDNEATTDYSKDYVVVVKDDSEIPVANFTNTKLATKSSFNVAKTASGLPEGTSYPDPTISVYKLDANGDKDGAAVWSSAVDANGDTLYATTLLDNGKYLVEETIADVNGYKCTASVSVNGQAAENGIFTVSEAGKTFSIIVNNSYEALPTQASYTVKYYWNGQPIPGVEEMTGSAVVGTTINDISKTIDGYKVKDNQPTSLEVSATASENKIIINYYKVANVWAPTVEKKVGEDLGLVLPTQDVPQGSISYEMNGVPSNSNTVGEYPLIFTGDEIQGEYKVIYHPGKLTIYDTYTVTYKDGRGGAWFEDDVHANLTAGTKTPGYTKGIPSHKGYDFKGWSPEVADTVTENVVYIAQWESKSEKLIKELLGDIKVECVNTSSGHGAKTYDTSVGGYSAVTIENADGSFTSTITVSAARYVEKYNADMNVTHRLADGQADTQTVKVTFDSNYDKASVKVIAGELPVTFKVTCAQPQYIKVKVHTASAEKVYDGTALTKPELADTGIDATLVYSDGTEKTLKVALGVDNDNFYYADLYTGNDDATKDDHDSYAILKLKVTGSQTEVGSSKNTYKVDAQSIIDNKLTGLTEGDKTVYVQYDDSALGTLKVTKKSTPVNPGIYTEITVTITGSSDSVVYDGAEHSVKGYTVKISDPRYTEKDFTFTGKAEASGVNAGTYEMGLKAEQFKNTNARFTNVKFVIKADGVLTITPKELTITAGSKTEYGPTPVTCGEWTVSGLAAGDKVESVKITGIQSVPGSSPNVPSDAVIKNAKGEDVTKNYAIKYVNGTLTMLEVLNKEDHFNYIIGTPEGLSLPTANVTRAEVATIFFRLMTDDARAKFDSLDNNFSDVAKGKWYNRAISTLAKAGIIKGDPAGTYRPGDPITRAEMAAIIARFGDFKEGGKTFSDISGHWAQKYIELAASNGWINGNPDGTFKPNNNITRAETVAMINRVLDRQTESNDDLLPVSQMTNWSDNMDTAKWYYRDMQEATNNHKAERVGDSIYEKWTEKLPDIDWASYQI